MCRYHWWSARLRCVCFEMFLSPAVARCPFLSCTGSPQSMWGEQRMPSSQRPTTASTSSSKSLLSTWVFLKKRPMTLEVWCDERTFPTQLKVTKEWILMSLLESVWRCVVMFWEWAELGGGGAIVPALRWPGHSEPICATWLLITSVSTRACLRPPLCLCTCRCRGCSGSRGDAEQSRPLSLRLLSPR